MYYHHVGPIHYKKGDGHSQIYEFKGAVQISETFSRPDEKHEASDDPRQLSSKQVRENAGNRQILREWRRKCP